MFANLILASALLLGGTTQEIDNHKKVTEIPPRFVAVAKVAVSMLEADPKKGEFREVTILSDGGKYRFTETGWVLPGGRKRFIGWDGIVREASLIGPTTRLEDYVKDVGWEFEPGCLRFITEGEEHKARAEGSLMSAAILLHLGKPQLALKMYKKCSNWSFDTPDWVFANYVSLLWDAALNSYAKGQDAQALSTCENIGGARKRFESQVKGWNGVPPKFYAPKDFDGFTRYLGSIRRSPEHKRPDLTAIIKLPIAERVPKLIEALEFSGPVCYINPGGMQIQWDPSVRALTDCGQPALELLRQCIKTDKRYTRIVNHDRFSERKNGVYTVARIAEHIVEQISPTPKPNFATPNDLKRPIFLIPDRPIRR